MTAITTQFRNTDLKYLIDSVPRYPVSIKSIITIASRHRLSPAIINFYRGFPETVKFNNEKEIIEQTELVSLLREEEVTQPDEDAVRGAED